MTIRRQWNSTIPERKKPMARGTKPIPKVNPERQKKAAKRGRSKHARYMASEARRIVDERACGQCEFEARSVLAIPPNVFVRYVPTRDGGWRCEETMRLEHHHKTYARYGGNELPEDVIVVCNAHHDYLESLKPAGNRRSRSRRASVGAG